MLFQLAKTIPHTHTHTGTQQTDLEMCVGRCSEKPLWCHKLMNYKVSGSVFFPSCVCHPFILFKAMSCLRVRETYRPLRCVVRSVSSGASVSAVDRRMTWQPSTHTDLRPMNSCILSAHTSRVQGGHAFTNTDTHTHLVNTNSNTDMTAPEQLTFTF